MVLVRGVSRVSAIIVTVGVVVVGARRLWRGSGERGGLCRFDGVFVCV